MHNEKPGGDAENEKRADEPVPTDPAVMEDALAQLHGGMSAPKNPDGSDTEVEHVPVPTVRPAKRPFSLFGSRLPDTPYLRKRKGQEANPVAAIIETPEPRLVLSATSATAAAAAEALGAEGHVLLQDSLEDASENGRTELSESVRLTSDQTFTVSFWYRGTQEGKLGDTGYGLVGVDADYYAMLTIQDGKAQYAHYDDGDWQQNIQSKSNINNGKWHHILLTSKGNDASLYVDGVLEVKDASSRISDNSFGFQVADVLRTYGEKTPTEGEVRNVGVYDGVAFNGAEVEAVFKSNHPEGVVELVEPDIAATADSIAETVAAQLQDEEAAAQEQESEEAPAAPPASTTLSSTLRENHVLDHAFGEEGGRESLSERVRFRSDEDFTVSFQYRGSETAADKGLVTENYPDYYGSITTGEGGTVQYMTHNGKEWKYITSQSSIADNTLHTVTLVNDGASETATLYIDGVEEARGSSHMGNNAEGFSIKDFLVLYGDETPTAGAMRHLTAYRAEATAADAVALHAQYLPQPAVEPVVAQESQESTPQESTPQASAEKQIFIPRMHAVAAVGSQEIIITYEDMPSGFAVKIDGGEKVAIPEGSGTLTLQNSDITQEDRDIDVIGPDGDPIGGLGRYRSNRRTVTIGVEGSDSFPELAYRMEGGQRVAAPQESSEEVKPQNIAALRVSGPNILLNVRSSLDETTVKFNAPGMLTAQTITHAGGTDFTPVVLTFNADLPSGVYRIEMTGPDSPFPEDTLGVHWDQGNRILRVASADDWYEGGDGTNAAAAAARETFADFSALDSIDLTGASFASQQGIELYQKSRFFIPGERVPAIARAAMPDFFPEDFIAHTEALADAQGRNLGQVQDELNRQRNETIQSIREHLGGYEELMGEVMEAAVSYIIDLRNGGSERAGREELEELVSRVQGHGDANEMTRYGVYIPSVEELIPEAMRLADAELGRLLGRQAKAADETAEFNAVPEEPSDEEAAAAAAVGGGGAPVRESDEVTEGEARNIRAITEAHGDDLEALGLRLRNYAVSRGLPATNVFTVALGEGANAGIMAFVEGSVTVASNVSGSGAQSPDDVVTVTRGDLVALAGTATGGVDAASVLAGSGAVEVVRVTPTITIHAEAGESVVHVTYENIPYDLHVKISTGDRVTLHAGTGSMELAVPHHRENVRDFDIYTLEGEFLDGSGKDHRMQVSGNRLQNSVSRTIALDALAYEVEVVDPRLKLRDELLDSLGLGERQISEEILEEVKNYDSSKPLVVIFLGSNQRAGLGDTGWAFEDTIDDDVPQYSPNPSLPGLNSLALRLRNEGYQVKVFETGSNPSDPFLNGKYDPNVFGEHPAKQYSNEWLEALYLNESNPGGIVSVGYSWGGSRQVATLNTLTSRYQIPILASVNLDAIDGLFDGPIPGVTGPEYSAPQGTMSHLDIFGEAQNSAPLGLNGAPVNNLPSGTPHNILLIEHANHAEIDNDWQVLNKIYTFITDRVRASDQ